VINFKARPLVVVEYAQYGDVLGYLRRSRGVSDNYYSDPSVKPCTSLTSKQLLKFAWEISDGMHYLSSKKVSFPYISLIESLLFSCLLSLFTPSVNPIQTGLFLVFWDRGGGGGADSATPS